MNAVSWINEIVNGFQSKKLQVCSSDDKNYDNLLFKLVRVEEKVRYRKKPSKLIRLLQYSLRLEPIQSTMKKTHYVYGIGLTFA